jgi:hypothetical protein
VAVVDTIPPGSVTTAGSLPFWLAAPSVPASSKGAWAEAMDEVKRTNIRAANVRRAIVEKLRFEEYRDFN